MWPPAVDSDEWSQYEWDDYFLGLAQYVSTKSKDPSTKCGAVLVRADRSIASTGYNGFPRKMPDHTRWYNDRVEKYARVVHAEINALLTLAERASGMTLYLWPLLTCDKCAILLIQAGVIRIVSPECTTEQLSRWGDSFSRAKDYYETCGVRYETVPYVPRNFDRIVDKPTDM